MVKTNDLIYEKGLEQGLARSGRLSYYDSDNDTMTTRATTTTQPRGAGQMLPSSQSIPWVLHREETIISFEFLQDF